MLIGEHQRWRQATVAERIGDRRQFDCFRSGADDQPYVSKTQASPLIRLEETAFKMEEEQA
jgi:hypothetical protein